MDIDFLKPTETSNPVSEQEKILATTSVQVQR